jgi:hypothetical protein
VTACNPQAQPSSPPPKLEVATVTELGTVGKPKIVTTRDVGGSAIIGGKVLWVFGDTLFNPKSVDGTNLRSSTAALADPATPLELSEPLDANGAPFQFIPFTTEEIAQSPNPQDRIALWTGDPVPDEGNGALVWYLKMRIQAGFLNYTHLGVGLARVAPGATTAAREPELLFGANEPLLTNAARFGDTVYVYGVRGLGAAGEVVVARVPLSSVAQRGAYQFWNGSSWVSDVGAAVTVFNGVPAEMTVSWNPYLQRYLAVYSSVLAGKVVARVASRPEGPWSEPTALLTMKPAVDGFSYAGREHPGLRTRDGKSLFVTYYQPLGAFRGELLAVRVDLR